jgi:putative flippase GtrA
MTPADQTGLPAVDVRPRAMYLRLVLRYGISGAFAALVYFTAVMALVEGAGIAPVFAASLATVAVIVTSYLVNRFWVFSTNRSHASAFLRFATASGFGIGLNTGLMYLAVDVLGWRYLAGVALATVVLPPINFAINYLWCFRPALPARG